MYTHKHQTQQNSNTLPPEADVEMQRMETNIVKIQGTK